MLLSIYLQEVGKSLGEAQEDVQQLEQRLQAEQTCRGVMRAKMEALVHVTSQFKSVFHRSMTQLVNYDQRLALLSGHVQSISGVIVWFRYFFCACVCMCDPSHLIAAIVSISSCPGVSSSDLFDGARSHAGCRLPSTHCRGRVPPGDGCGISHTGPAGE